MTLLKKHVVLKKNEDRRINAGHPWVYSNEIRTVNGDPAIGDVVEIVAAGGRSLGIGFYNPHSLIAVRKLSSTVVEIDRDFFRQRIASALTLRQKLFDDADAFRVIHGEGDFLPGLIVDRFADSLVLQTYSYGMDTRLPVLCDVLEELLSPRTIVERNESHVRALEHLEQKSGILRGSVHPVEIDEHGLRYAVDILGGQKTGFFLDQRENRLAVRPFSRNAIVLDCFCNYGGFALNSAAAGARSVTGLDSSPEAVAGGTFNAVRNGLTAVRFEEADVFIRLAELASEGTLFDVIVLDPPSFTRSRKNVYSAKLGYKELHRLALQVLAPGGILLTSSCSHHIEPAVFLKVVDESARQAGRSLQMLDWRGASPDHPTLPSVPETRYLKFGIFRVN
jgi:23S rRNA (cytosine1962-C5)-methyltransferase